MVAGWTQEQPVSAGAEARMAQFTELMATAIANGEARTEVAASRARIVATADEERRRVVRDLHDGAQQGLVLTVITLKLAHRAMQNGDGELKLSAGTLYRSIQRMLEQGLIVETEERPDPEMDDTRRRYYRLTRFGRRVLAAESERLEDLVRVIRSKRRAAEAES